MIEKTYHWLFAPEKNKKQLGVFRTLMAVVGGLVVAYLAMTLLAFVLPGDLASAATFALMFNTLAWAGVALWIAVAPTKFRALMRVVVPALVCVGALYGLGG